MSVRKIPSYTFGDAFREIIISSDGLMLVPISEVCASAKEEMRETHRCMH